MVLSGEWVRLLLLLTTGFLLSACSQPSRLAAVPSGAVTRASVLDLPNARFLVTDRAAMAAEGRASLEREKAARKAEGRSGPLPTAHFLALSGGGDDGAFGAGLLRGWSERGDRPTFKLVTGISTGALSAPFIFLGPAYDDALAEVYTQSTQTDIFKRRSILAAVTDDALTDTTPLYGTISRYLDDAFLDRIAAEYDKGRLLLVATTNLDAAQPVIWNIGAIAKSGGPQRLELVRRILLASAAIPAAFPPVMFDVTADGQAYQEMHVDGGAVAQVFLYPPTLSVRESPRRRVAYIIRNGKLSPPWEDVKRRTVSIAGRAIATMIASSGVGDTYRIYATTQRDGVAFNLAYIGDDFQEPYPGPFDPGYMGKLYRYGQDRGRRGTGWQTTPPGYGAASGASRSLTPLRRRAAARLVIRVSRPSAAGSSRMQEPKQLAAEIRENVGKSGRAPSNSLVPQPGYARGTAAQTLVVVRIDEPIRSSTTNSTEPRLWRRVGENRAMSARRPGRGDHQHRRCVLPWTL